MQINERDEADEPKQRIKIGCGDPLSVVLITGLDGYWMGVAVTTCKGNIVVSVMG
jgi:hypothetical protein